MQSIGPSPQTVFRAGIDARLVDLTQALAGAARQATIDAIRYESVRDPEHGAAVAVLQPACFKPRKPLQRHTWFLTVRRAVVIWQREAETFEFDANAWRQ